MSQLFPQFTPPTAAQTQDLPLYRDVLNDLWEADPGLNDGITELGVDLSETSLPA